MREILNAKNNHLLLLLQVALKTVTYLEILMQNNPQRPIIVEMAMLLMRCAEDPLQNVKLDKDMGQKLTLRDREMVEVFQQKSYGVLVEPGLLAEVRAEDLFDGEEFALHEDVTYILQILRAGNSIQKQACGEVLLQILQKLNGKAEDRMSVV